MLLDDPGNHDIVAISKGGCDSAHRLGFVDHIDFERDVSGELVVNGLEGVVAEAGFQPDEATKDAKIGADEAGAVRIDDLDGDLTAILQFRLVDLRE